MIRRPLQPARRQLSGRKVGPKPDVLKHRPVKASIVKIPHLVISPGDPGVGFACVVDVIPSPNPAKGNEIDQVAIARIAFQRMTGKLMGTLEEYVAWPSDPGGINYKYIDYLMLRSSVIIAHDVEVARRLLLDKVETAGIRMWRSSATDVDWAVTDEGSLELADLLAAHHVQMADPPMGMEGVYSILGLLCRNDDRGRSYLFQVVVM